MTKRWARWKPDAFQQSVLETLFQSNQFIEPPIRNSIARCLNATPRNIQVWFQNHRQRNPASRATLLTTPMMRAINQRLVLENVYYGIPVTMEHLNTVATICGVAVSDVLRDIVWQTVCSLF